MRRWGHNSASGHWKRSFSRAFPRALRNLITLPTICSMADPKQRYSRMTFQSNWLLYLVQLKGCLHDTGATFAPEWAHSGSLSWLYIFYMIPPQNVMPALVTPAWVHPGCCTGARISLRYEISQRYHINTKQPQVSVWNRSAGRLEWVAHA